VSFCLGEQPRKIVIWFKYIEKKNKTCVFILYLIAPMYRDKDLIEIDALSIRAKSWSSYSNRKSEIAFLRG